jgi:hypothetical protein
MSVRSIVWHILPTISAIVGCYWPLFCIRSISHFGFWEMWFGVWLSFSTICIKSRLVGWTCQNLLFCCRWRIIAGHLLKSANMKFPVFCMSCLPCTFPLSTNITHVSIIYRTNWMNLIWVGGSQLEVCST